ncbi:DUF4926 domain-containing protein [Prosthecobacter dejongeii]|uniref:DUF4926 domain-containing protein n=1 Tax=Prosthecobacter dejongeii TaxID=48465 RepID=A0A7W7YJI8_9BACT|nr:DUF4926 domain-containing protein [Prosthecobacter dejongeii]MBB5037405.1 hypothetical protein [Prosthecobacter dejongeii]
MIEELSLVRLIRPISSPAIPVGSIGTVLIVYEDTPPAYEVEFIDVEGTTLEDPETDESTFTVSEDDVEPWLEKLEA